MKCKCCLGDNVTGVEITGAYDGILYFECQDCLYKHHAFKDKQISSIEWLGDGKAMFLFNDNTKCVNRG